MKIAVQLLKNLSACPEQIDLFEKFLNGRQFCLLTESNIKKAAKFDLDVSWLFGRAKLTGSFIDRYGNEHHYRDGKRHREDGPAVVYASGTSEWYRDGKRHREDGPALVRADGSQFWFRDGKLHREDGPAIIYPDGSRWWYIDDILLTESEFNSRGKI